MTPSDGLEQIGAVPAAESLGALTHVSDEEFDAWVKRSRDQTDAVLEEWDSSVEFEQERYGDAGVTMEVDGDEVIDVEILDENAAAGVLWQNLRERIQRGEEVGPEIRNQFAGQTLGPCTDPTCMVCHPPAGEAVTLPPWAGDIAGQLIRQMESAGPSARIVVSMPPLRHRSALVDLASNVFIDRTMGDRETRRNLESMGFVVMDGRAGTITLPLAALVKETNRWGYFVSELEVMKATVNRPPDLIMGVQRQARFEVL